MRFRLNPRTILEAAAKYVRYKKPRHKVNNKTYMTTKGQKSKEKKGGHNKT